MDKLVNWLRKLYNKSIHGIAFYPALITIGFLLLFMLVYYSESSGTAMLIKQKFVWLNLKNTDAAHSILTTVATGIISLTAFSFSMVMLVAVQAGSLMTNRILDHLIGKRQQQATLGCYLGTIVASFFLLTVVDDQGTTQVPSISVFLLAFLAIIDLFLFVSFLHDITQSIRFEQLIKRIHQKAVRSMDRFNAGIRESGWPFPEEEPTVINCPLSGYFQGINRQLLLQFLAKHNWQVAFCHLRCTYLVKGEPFLHLYSKQQPGEKEIKRMFDMIDFYTGQEVDKNPFYGFVHLTEVAVKALSPGINDPNTAVLCIHALTDLLVLKMHQKPSDVLTDIKGHARIFLKDHSFEDLFTHCIYSILDYGKKDRFVQKAMSRMLHQLEQADKQRNHSETLEEFKQHLNGLSVQS